MEEGREEEGVLHYFPVRIVLLDWCRIIYKIDLPHIYFYILDEEVTVGFALA